MKEFIAIDFETANSKRVSACALGYVAVSNSRVIEVGGYLIKPIGGHAPFQSKIHGIKEEHTASELFFGELFPEIKEIFAYPLVGHSLFDKQVLLALSNHFDLNLKFKYVDACATAKEVLPDLKNHKLKTLVKHFGLPSFRHHDAEEDALACAKIFLKLQDKDLSEGFEPRENDQSEFTSLINEILADDEVDYKEAYELLYWLEDHPQIAKEHDYLYSKTREFLLDDKLNQFEVEELKTLIIQARKTT